MISCSRLDMPTSLVTSLQREYSVFLCLQPGFNVPANRQQHASWRECSWDPGTNAAETAEMGALGGEKSRFTSGARLC